MKTGKILVKSHPLTNFLLFFLILFPGFTFAQVLGKYEFTGVTIQQTQNYFSEVTEQPAHAVFSPFSRSVVQWWRGDNVYNSREWAKDSTDHRYIEFTVTAKPGHRLHLNKITYTTYRTSTGPTSARLTHNFSGSFDSDVKRYAVSETNQTIEWDFDDIVTPAGGSVTFRLYGFGSSNYLGAMRVDNVSLFGITTPEARVNEFHYANTAATKTGFVEVALPKDFTQLNTLILSLYTPEGNVYGSYNLSLFKSIDTGIFDDERIVFLDIPDGLLQNQGGLSISAGAHVIQFISYGGAFAAVSGPAAGIISKDVIVTETAEDGASSSVYLTVADDTRFQAGIWVKGTYNSKGYPNTESYSVLPVELLFFRADIFGKQTTLTWATATEKNNDKFLVERSRNELSNFEAIGTVKGNGTTHSQQQYRFIDTRPVPGTSYYRLKQIDSDGTFTYSPIKAVNRELGEQALSFYPNPATSFLNIYVGEAANVKQMHLRIVNSMGKVVYQNVPNASLTDKSLLIPISNLPAGTYYLVLVKDGKQESKTFIKM